MSLIKLHQLQGMGNTVESRLENDIIITESMIKTIKSLKEDIDSIELFKLCLSNIMRDGKGHLDPNYVNQSIKHYLERYVS